MTITARGRSNGHLARNYNYASVTSSSRCSQLNIVSYLKSVPQTVDGSKQLLQQQQQKQNHNENVATAIKIMFIYVHFCNCCRRHRHRQR